MRIFFFQLTQEKPKRTDAVANVEVVFGLAGKLALYSNLVC